MMVIAVRAKLQTWEQHVSCPKQVHNILHAFPRRTGYSTIDINYAGFEIFITVALEILGCDTV
jgi:hypothetical protein